MDNHTDPPEPAQEPCPNDTNGDGDCGKPACPHCGEHGKRLDLSDTPVPQRRTNQY